MSTAEPNLVPEDDPASSSYYLFGAADRAMAVLDRSSAVGFQAIVELDRPVDIAALGTAWTRLSARHPILTCVRNGDRWRPSSTPPFGENTVPPDHDRPPIAMRVTSTTSGQRLTLLCNHVAFDGVASRILLGDLREEYNGVLDGLPQGPPDLEARTFEAVAHTSNWRETAASVVRATSAWWRTPVSTHVDPATSTATPAEEHTVIEMGPLLAKLAPERRKYRWSVDAILVGVLEKSWSRVFGPPSAASSWLVARDLRTALGVSRGIGNLSAAAGLSLITPTADLDRVIDQAETALTSQVNDLAAVASSVGGWAPVADVSFAQMLRRSERLRAHRSVSNVGQLGHDLENWGESRLERIWFVGPLAHPPYVSFIAAGHGSSTLVSLRVSRDWVTPEHAIALESAMQTLI